MKKIKLFLGYPLIFLLLWSCSAMMSTVNYIGKSYPSTEKTDVYYSKNDIPKEYETMGHAEVVIPYANVSSADLQKCLEKLEGEACKKGADAIIVEGLDTATSTSGFGSTISGDTKKIIKATFIKYN